MRRCLTGFKYIGDIIADVEQKEGSYESFLLGFEESYGYLSGGYVRDKDAVDGSMLICEMASYYKAPGQDPGGRHERPVLRPMAITRTPP